MESPLFATPNDGSYCSVALACRSAQSWLGLHQTMIEDSLFEEAKTPGASQVIICTPSKAGVLTSLLITGPAVGESLKAKMLSDPSHRPTAKWRISIQVVSWAIVYVTPSAVMGRPIGAAAPAARKLTPWAARCSRDLMTGGIALKFFWIIVILSSKSPIVPECSDRDQG